MKKHIKILLVLTVLSLLATGCSNTSDVIVQNQSAEILQLQEIRAQILLRETKTSNEQLSKAADLKLVNDQIKQTMETAQHAQMLSNQQHAQKTTNAVGIGTIILGTGALIHQMTK